MEKHHTLITSARFHTLIIPLRAASSEGHKGNLRFGSYESMLPDLLAMSIAASCVDLQGSSIKLIEP